MSDLTPDAEKSLDIKIALRARLLTARRSLPVTERSAAAAKLHHHILDLVRVTGARSVAAYVPVGSEPGGPDLPERLLAALPPDGRLLLPVLLPDNDLDWAPFSGPTSLQAGPRGLREPTGTRLGVTAIRSVDLLLVPALAVGHDGVRMGRGGGSYDRALARLTAPPSGLAAGSTGGHTPRAMSGPVHGSAAGPVSGPLVAALLHDGEDVAVVPAEPHDRPVHAVLTPSGGLSRRPLPHPSEASAGPPAGRM